MATFDERAAGWDTPERIERAEAIAAFIRERDLLPAGSRVIEVGAGTGLLGLALADDFAELVLADTSEGMLDVARRKILERGLAQARIESLDLVDGGRPPGAPFDACLSLLLLHHVEHTLAALAAMHRLLVPGGRLLAADLDTEDGTFHDPEAEGIHHLGFDRDRLADLAGEAGFVDIRFETPFTIRGESRDYPIFLLVARRGDA